MIEMKKRFLEDTANREEYNAFFYDRNSELLESVVYNWAINEGIEKIKARSLALYVVNCAIEDYPA